jgi:hypothetical protein
MRATCLPLPAYATSFLRMEIKMPEISLVIARKAAHAPEKRANIIFGVGIAVVLTLLAILSVVTGVAPTVDPAIFPAP